MNIKSAAYLAGSTAAQLCRSRDSHYYAKGSSGDKEWLAGYDAEIEAQAGRADEPAKEMEPSPYPVLFPKDAFCQQQKAWKSAQQGFSQNEFDARYMKPNPAFAEVAIDPFPSVMAQEEKVSQELAVAKAEIARLQAQIAAAQPLQHPAPTSLPKPAAPIFRAIAQPAAMDVGIITEMRR